MSKPRNRSRSRYAPKRRKNSSSGSQRAQLVRLSSISSSGRSIVQRDWLRCDPLLLTVNSAAVVFTGTPYVNFDSTQILDSACQTRVNTFQDWRMLKISARVIPLAAAFGGCSSFGFSEEPGDAGSSTYAVQGNCLVLSNNSNNSSPRSLSWSASNFEDLSFKPTTATISPIPVIFNAYTDNTNFGTPNAVSTTMVFRVEFYMLAEMRGITA